jgi:long-chain acyl-CoA synthetase
MVGDRSAERAEHSGIIGLACPGLTPAVRGDDTVKAFIVAQPNEQPTAEEIREFCKLHLAPYKIPRAIEFRSELPRTIVGKVLWRVLIELGHLAMGWSVSESGLEELP